MRISACLISTGFIFASIYVIVTSGHTNEAKFFFASLDKPKQLEIYNEIVSERVTLFLQGQILGILVGAFYLYFFKKNSYNYCIFSLTTYIIATLYYMIMPKQKYILDYLTTNEQIILWRRNSNAITNSYITGFILGMIGYILLARILITIL